MPRPKFSELRRAVAKICQIEETDLLPESTLPKENAKRNLVKARRTFATVARDYGYGWRVISEQLGHPNSSARYSLRYLTIKQLTTLDSLCEAVHKELEITSPSLQIAHRGINPGRGERKVSEIS